MLLRVVGNCCAKFETGLAFSYVHMKLNVVWQTNASRVKFPFILKTPQDSTVSNIVV